jgi:hypothetical protein
MIGGGHPLRRLLSPRLALKAAAQADAARGKGNAEAHAFWLPVGRPTTRRNDEPVAKTCNRSTRNFLRVHYEDAGAEGLSAAPDVAC